AMNPEVTIRSRGVMEKCTYCIQRINRGTIDAKLREKPLADGEIRTACQQTCSTGAIVFGDLRVEGSRTARLKTDDRNYTLLTELATRPRTSYLARILNPGPGQPASAGRRAGKGGSKG
ncbi:MAG: molybdopterin oxidoreductase, partial [Acidobacteriota bacterium]